MPSFFTSSVNVTQRPPTPAQLSAERRHKVHKLRPIAVVPSDTTDRSWAMTKRYIEEHHETMRPAFILSELTSELHLVGDDAMRRMQAHRKAFEAITKATDGATQELLTLVFNAYERSAGKGAADTYNLLLQKKDESDRENRRLTAERAKMEHRMNEMTLHIHNLERKLRNRTEQLTELSARHNIPLHFSDDAGSDGRTRTMNEIRGYQEKLRAKVAGLDSKEAISREMLETIERQLAVDCAEAEDALGDITSLEGIALERPDASRAESDQCEALAVVPDASPDEPFTTRDIYSSAQHPRYGGGQVCVDLEADVDDAEDIVNDVNV